jgi:hypothetical protein
MVTNHFSHDWYRPVLSTESGPAGQHLRLRVRGNSTSRQWSLAAGPLNPMPNRRENGQVRIAAEHLWPHGEADIRGFAPAALECYCLAAISRSAVSDREAGQSQFVDNRRPLDVGHGNP